MRSLLGRLVRVTLPDSPVEAYKAVFAATVRGDLNRAEQLARQLGMYDLGHLANFAEQVTTLCDRLRLDRTR